MANPLIREKARALRKKGASIGEIVSKLKQPKSTVSYWCKNIVLTKKQINKIQERHRSQSVATLLHSAEKQRQERLRREKKAALLGARDVGGISTRDLFMLGLGLYWGEGYKYENSELGFTNSNPDMIRTYVAWLENMYGVQSKDLICRISINQSHHNRVHVVEQYWQKKLKLPAKQFTTTSLIQSKSKKIYANREAHYGTLRVKVRRGKQLRDRIIASIAHVAKIYHD